MVISNENEIDKVKCLLEHQEPVKYLSKSEKDSAVLQAIYYLIASNYSAVNIISHFDNSLEEAILPFLEKLDVVIYDGNIKWVYSRTDHYKKWFPKGSKLLLRNSNCEIHPEFHLSSLSDLMFEVVKEGIIILGSPKKGFWLGEVI